MNVITWIPKSNKEYDTLFDSLRENQYQDKSHRYWKNYSPESFLDTVVHTIYFNDAGNPEVCSSVSKRDCWPPNVFRILNRTWKITSRETMLRKLAPSSGYTVHSQIKWLSENTDFKLYFMSRQTTNWEDWAIKHFQENFNLSFETDNYKYLTCPNECDDTCWQKIIYNGNTEVLTQWKRQSP
jgi:hypothetical protein